MDSYEDIISVKSIIKSLKEALVKHNDVDVITITANGEPTLYPYLSELIDNINLIENKPQTLILSNGSTIDKKEVQDALLKLDSVKLSLDCATAKCLKKIDRSHIGIDIDNIKRGLIEFRERYSKPLIIEILFVDGINDKKSEIEKLDNFLMQLNPDRVDIGTIDRPPAYAVNSLNFDDLYQISQKFNSSLPIYISSRKQIKAEQKAYNEEEILQTISKRPLSDDDIYILFDKNSQQTVKKLLKEGKITEKVINFIKFYIIL
jgi:wyosine [tRNA(Phe)-imidazoG37] synthetase (radical SAM superfamily)